MGNAILATEIFGMLAVGILLYGAWFETRDRNIRAKMFMLLSSSVFFALFVDALSYVPFDWASHKTGHFAITLAAFILPLLVYTFFLHYMYIHITSKTSVENLSKSLFIVGILFSAVGIGASIYYGYTGKLFDLTGGVFAPGEYYNGYLMTYVVILTFTFLIVFINFKKLGVHDSLAALMFMLIPLTAIIINLVNEDFAFSVSSLSLSMVIINTMIQADREQTLIVSEAVTKKLARSDELTKLQNRLAYSERMETIGNNGKMGVIFADINGLKYTNDNQGHKAGDKLICDFADMLKKCFVHNEIFRISGDEFVVFITDVTKGRFEMKADALREKVSKYEFTIASIGSSYGEKADLTQLLTDAESNMYKEKREFHANNPMFARVSSKVD